MEYDFYLFPSEVAAEANEVGFDGFVAVADGWRDTDVHGGRPWLGIDDDFGYVDPLGRHGTVQGFDVGGGETDLAAHPAAGDDFSEDGVLSTEEEFDALEIALEDSFANEGAAYAFGVDDEGGYLRDFEAVFGAEPLEEFKIASGPTAEAAVMADDYGH